MDRQRLLPILILLLAACAPSAASQATPATTATSASPVAPAVSHSEPPIATAAVSAAAATAVPTMAPTAASTAVPAPSATATPSITLSIAYSYPIGVRGRPLGDGFFIRHGYASENTWYNPGYWHTGEDWYAQQGDTAGAEVYAVAAGTVVYAGANYPGRVVIVRHADGLFSMYGHLDPDLVVHVGQQVARGDQIGTVLRRDDKTPNHLHFELRTFLTTAAVNGTRPRYPFRCGQNCPPGPGYWPLNAPDHPSALGWRNPTHVLASRMLSSDIQGQLGEIVVASRPISQSVLLWSAPPGNDTPQALAAVELHPGERFSLIAIAAGAEDTRATSALAYQLWYQIRLPDGRTGWVQAAVASTFETGSDGRPSSVYFNFLPAIETPL